MVLVLFFFLILKSYPAISSPAGHNGSCSLRLEESLQGFGQSYLTRQLSHLT